VKGFATNSSRTVRTVTERGEFPTATGLVGSSHARRHSREAIYASLERFGLITRTRGGVPFSAAMCEGIS